MKQNWRSTPDFRRPAFCQHTTSLRAGSPYRCYRLRQASRPHRKRDSHIPWHSLTERTLQARTGPCLSHRRSPWQRQRAGSSWSCLKRELRFKRLYQSAAVRDDVFLRKRIRDNCQSQSILSHTHAMRLHNMQRYLRRAPCGRARMCLGFRRFSERTKYLRIHRRNCERSHGRSSYESVRNGYESFYR